MFIAIYDTILFLGVLIFLPWLLFGSLVSGRFKGCLRAYFGLFLPKEKTGKGRSFLVYAVSVGEVRSAAVLCKKIKEEHPDVFISFASRTRTGYETSLQAFPLADRHFLMPFDFSWIMRRLMRRLQVEVLILVEGDIWLNLLQSAKKRGAAVFLVSGKMSSYSCERWKKVPFFTKKLITCFDLICTQNTLFQEHFISLGAHPDRVAVAGNLKFDAQTILLSQEEVLSFRKKLGIREGDRVITVGSTHEGEEEGIIKALDSLLKEDSFLKLILVPRHPERFSRVQDMLRTFPYPFISFSQIAGVTEKEKIILGDVMGCLSSFYQIADVAITGGSFRAPLRGHNILEPIYAGVPVVFGPYMDDQQDLVHFCLAYQAGVQVPLEELSNLIALFFSSKQLSKELREHGTELLLETRGACARTFNLINYF